MALTVLSMIVPLSGKFELRRTALLRRQLARSEPFGQSRRIGEHCPDSFLIVLEEAFEAGFVTSARPLDRTEFGVSLSHVVSTSSDARSYCDVPRPRYLRNFRMTRTLLLLLAIGTAGTPLAASDDWIVESNRYAQLLLDVDARYNPEATASLGVEGHDAEIIDLKPRASERQEADLTAVASRLEALRATATDPRVQQDLDILLDAAHDQRKTSELTRKYLLPFFDLAQSVFRGFRTLLDERVAKDRQQAAVTRLRRYVGAEPGYAPITTLARERYDEKAGDPALLGPWIVEAQQYLDNQSRYLDGIGELLPPRAASTDGKPTTRRCASSSTVTPSGFAAWCCRAPERTALCRASCTRTRSRTTA